MILQQTERELSQSDVLQGLRARLQALSGDDRRYNSLLALIGDARFALLGEASHGTHEFYRERAEITKRLILEKGFTAVAVEADWPDAWRVNRYVRGLSGDADANAALSGFERFPAWMWRNTVVRDFVEWLRAHNRTLPADRQVGFYGLDLYSLFTSMQVVLTYLAKVVLQTFVWVDPGASTSFGRGPGRHQNGRGDLRRRCQVLDSKGFPCTEPPGLRRLGPRAIRLFRVGLTLFTRFPGHPHETRKNRLCAA